MKKLVFVIFCLVVLACKDSGKVARGQLGSVEVNFKGALKNMMHNGDITKKATLKNFENNEGFYAIGAIEGLKGEVQIFNGKPFNTFIKGTEVKVDTTFKKNATLLVYSNVKEWKSIKIPNEVKSYIDLENFIKKESNLIGLNHSKGFPFLVEGKLKEVKWHVIDWKDGDKEHTHEKHKTSGLNGILNNVDAELLGFYSDAHTGIFTHHSTNVHIHVKVKSHNLAGHVDDLKLGNEIKLKLPIK